ncbi:MAG: hypothetical protein LBN23_02410, partial [Paludibacter sp.]|nr:hypothetical protein [Paludibacter sp.]
MKNQITKKIVQTRFIASRQDGGGANATCRRKSLRGFRGLLPAVLLLVAVLFMPATARAMPGGGTNGGSGTEGSPYTINNANDWNTFKSYFAGSSQTNQNKHWKLTTDINIGSNYGVGSQSNPFQGTFDGGGHTITMNAITITSSSSPNALFSVTRGAYFSNLTIVCPAIAIGAVAGVVYIGTLVALIQEEFSATNCHVKLTGASSVPFGSYIGGFAGAYFRITATTVPEFSFCSVEINSLAIGNPANTSSIFVLQGFGGFLGSDISGSGVSFKDCLVKINTVTSQIPAGNDYGKDIGGFLGFGTIGIQFADCVIDASMPIDKNAGRGQFVGYGINVSFTNCYNTKPNSNWNVGVGSQTSNSTVSILTDWNTKNVYDKLERANGGGSTIPSNEPGKKRWRYDNAAYPSYASYVDIEADKKAYAIKIT